MLKPCPVKIGWFRPLSDMLALWVTTPCCHHHWGPARLPEDLGASRGSSGHPGLWTLPVTAAAWAEVIPPLQRSPGQPGPRSPVHSFFWCQVKSPPSSPPSVHAPLFHGIIFLLSSSIPGREGEALEFWTSSFLRPQPGLVARTGAPYVVMPTASRGPAPQGLRFRLAPARAAVEAD